MNPFSAVFNAQFINKNISVFDIDIKITKYTGAINIISILCHLNY